MAGTGNLILKRGTTIPQDGQNSGITQLLKAMPATQLVGLSHVVNTSGTLTGDLVYAYENYPNRLWIGMDGFGTSGEEDGSGTGTGTGAGQGQWGGENGFGSQETSGAATRPIWFGAEIRADAAVYTSTGGTPDAVPTILQADWTNPSDYVLVTQKSIKSYVTSVSSSAVTILDVATAGKTGTLYPMMADDAGAGISIYVDKSATPFSYATSTNTLTITGELAVNGGDITTSDTGTATVFNTNATTLNLGGAATTVSLGAGSGTTTINNTNTVVTGDLAVNGGDITTSAATATVFNTTATSVSVGGAATTLNLGYINGAGVTTAQIINIGTNSGTSGSRTVNIGSASNTGGTNTLNVLGSSTGNCTVNLGTTSTSGTSNINLGSSSASSGSTVTVNKDLVVSGNLTVNGTTTTINSTTLTVDDKNVELAAASLLITSAGATLVSFTGSASPWSVVITVSGGDFTNVANGVTLTHAGGIGSFGGGTAVVTSSVSGTSITATVTGGSGPIQGSVFLLSVTGSDVAADGGGITLRGVTDKTLLWNSTSLGGEVGVWRSSENFSINGGKAYAVVDDIVLTKTYLKLYGSTSGSLTLKTNITTTDNTLVFPANTQTGVLTNSTSGSIGTLSWSASLGPTLGGTGLTSYTTGDLIYASASNTLTARNIGSTGDVLTVASGVPTWAAPAAGIATAVKLRRETNSTTKFPIMFGASAADGAMGSWSSLVAENAAGTTSVATDVYLMADWDGIGEATASAGLYYAPGDTTSGTQPSVSGGTLYAAFFAGYLDCGTYV